MKHSNKPWRLLRPLAAVTSVVLLAGCNSASGEAEDASDGGIAEEIELMGVYDLTGPTGYAGSGASKGIQLAIQEIEEENFLGVDASFTFEEFDAANEIERATSEVNRGLANPDIDAIFGPVTSQQSVAVAPMVEEAQVPTVFTQAGSDGVVIGDYTFRATAPMETFYDIVAEYLADEGLTDVSLLYNATYPTFAEIGEEVFPNLAEEHGINIVSSYSAQDNTQDFTSHTQDITSEDPDAVVMLLIPPQSVTALTQLGQAGYEGQVMAASSQAGGNVSEAGEHAEGLIYPVDFSAAQEDERAVAFTEAFTEKYGEAPDLYAAEGYDGMWWLAHGIEASGDSSREGIRQGMQEVAEQGFEGVMGDLTFEGNDLRVPGVLVKWDGSDEHVITE